MLVIPQPGWRWCAACHALVHQGGAGYCPGQGPPQNRGEATTGKLHNLTGSGSYVVMMTDGAIEGEAGWSWCETCAVLHRPGGDSGCYYQPTDWLAPVAGGNVPAGLKPHRTTRSAAYVLLTSAQGAGAFGQGGWRQCTKCSTLFHEGNLGGSACSVGGNHRPGATEYIITHG